MRSIIPDLLRKAEMARTEGTVGRSRNQIVVVLVLEAQWE
jgi:hypothetical protein